MKSDGDVFMLVLKPTIPTFFSAVDFDSAPHISTVRFIIHDANSTSECGTDYAAVVPEFGLSSRYLLVLTNFTKLKTENVDYEPSRKNLDCAHAFPCCSFIETSICVNAHIVKITISTYVIRLDCLLGFSEVFCSFPYQRIRGRWCSDFGDENRFIHVRLIFKLRNYQTARLVAYAFDRAYAQSVDSWQILYGFATVYRLSRARIRRRAVLHVLFKFVIRMPFFVYAILPNIWSVNSVLQFLI